MSIIYLSVGLQYYGHAMKENLGKKSKKILSRISDFRNWVSRKWVVYSYVKTCYIILYFPLLVYLAGVSSELATFLVVVLMPSLVVFVFLDSKKSSVVWENPDAFIKSEKVERAVERLFYALIALLFSFMFSIIGMGKLGLENWIKPYVEFVVTPTAILMGGTAIAVEVNLLEVLFAKIVKKFLKKRSLLKFFEFYVPSTLQTRARLCVVLETLTLNPNIRTINKKLPLFKEAISVYSNHLREKFDFVLREPEKFYRYVKLAAYAMETTITDDVRKGLEAFIKLMEKEEEDPYEVIKSLKSMMKETASMKDIFDEIDVEPKPLRKWFSVHSDSISAIVALLSLIASIIVAIIK